ncbi:MAG: rhomboid family intramembrane serine protease [Candidatus Riflebacteria bacterium]|nr:rhomboid family intramembrane serine protease [Candidatus Riflebacteria bacterium]
MSDFLLIVIWISLLSLIGRVISLITNDIKGNRFYIAQVFFAASLLGGFFYKSDRLGYVALAGVLLQFLQITLPDALSSFVENLILKNRPDIIYRPARLLALLAPSDKNQNLASLAKLVFDRMENPEMLDFHLAEEAKNSESDDILPALFLAIFRFHRSDYDGVIEAFSFKDMQKELPPQAYVLLTRAYLEIGDSESAVKSQLTLENQASKLTNIHDKVSLIISRMTLFSFLGWKEKFDELMSERMVILTKIPSSLLSFWRFVSVFNSGDFEAGSSGMQTVIANLSVKEEHLLPSMQRRYASLLENQNFLGEKMIPVHKRLYDEFASSFPIGLEEKMELLPPLKNKSFGTMWFGFFITVPTALFLSIGIQDLLQLINSGSLHSRLLAWGEYFRLIAYQFIHLNWLHFALNYLAFVTLAVIVENMAGAGAMYFIFLFSGTLGGLCSVYFRPETFTVGASGSIFGLFAAGIIFYYAKAPNYKYYSKVFTKANVFSLIFINVLITFVFPNIDIYSHLGGTFGGFLSGCLVILLFKIFKTKANLVKKTLMTISLGIMLLAFSQHLYLGFNNGFYPFKVDGYKTISAPENRYAAEFPESWHLRQKENIWTFSVDGSFGDSFHFLRFGDTLDEDFVAEFEKIAEMAVLKAKEETGTSLLGDNFQNLLKPKKIYQYLWDFGKPDGFSVHFLDYLIELENGGAWIRFVLPTDNISSYEPLIRKILSSLRINIS